MPKISVIIPVYNSERYLSKTLDSIVNQSLSDIEVICVDDGSTDESINILKEYLNKPCQLKIISLSKNFGVAFARNVGLKEASGEYICFVDSDDYISLDFCEKLYRKTFTSPDFVKAGDLNVIFPDRKEIWEQNKFIRENVFNFWAQFTTAIYNRDFLLKNNIFFDEELLVCEDILFLTKVVLLAKTYEIEELATYYYLKNSNSLDSDKYDDKKISSFINYVNKVSQIINTYEIKSDDKKVILTRLVGQIDLFRKNKVSEKSTLKSELSKIYQQKIIEKMRIR